MKNPLKKPRLHLPSGPTFIQRSRSVSPAFKAAIHEIEGAGKSRIKRQFFGLSDDDQALITDLVEKDIERRLAS